MNIRIEDFDRLDCRLKQHVWDFQIDGEGGIEAFWREEIRRNPSLYDGVILLASRVETRLDAEKKERTLEVDFFEARFSRFLAWRRRGFCDESVSNCFAMPALRTSDGAFLLGEMAPGHSAAGQIYFPAGTPDRSDVDGGKVDLLGSVVRELAEETGILVEKPSLSPGWRVVFAGRQVACMKLIDWPAPAVALAEEVARHLARESNPELSRVHLISRRAQLADPRIPAFVRAFLAEMTPP
jgi:8-oxo-dGTP pyrophosphatase MutT (NUDIX family)